MMPACLPIQVALPKNRSATVGWLSLAKWFYILKRPLGFFRATHRLGKHALYQICSLRG
jgi:hypothetical protein